tara:strand:+ start:22872 stop:23915 length:1044 start_codon:yes stop_codon:yes gene_type:complete
MTEESLEILEKSLDSEGMCEFTRSFVDDFESAMNMDVDLVSDSDWTGVIFLGMGGSGSSGRFLKTISNQEGGIPFVVWNDYNLPNWWGPEWLVIATSYSGNTEETLSGINKALELGGMVVGISSGGVMSEILAMHKGTVHVSIPKGQMPRSAFGHIFGAQLAVCWSMGILNRPNDDELQKMISRLKESTKKLDFSGGDGMSETLAKSLVDMEIGIVCPKLLEAPAYRLTCQINENSEAFAKHSVVPEMNHNEIVAWYNDSKSDRALLIMICEGLDDRTNSRITWMENNLDRKNVWKLVCEGDSLLERMIYAAHLSDWISICMALVKGVNPTSMEPIPDLKRHLSENQ